MKHEIEMLHQNILYVITTAVDLDAENKKFPKHWLFHYRWGKKNGEKLSPIKMPNGDSIIFETVAGRTSAVVKSQNKKVGSLITSTSKNASSSEIDETSIRVSATSSSSVKHSKKSGRHTITEEVKYTDEEQAKSSSSSSSSSSSKKRGSLHSTTVNSTEDSTNILDTPFTPTKTNTNHITKNTNRTKKIKHEPNTILQESTTNLSFNDIKRKRVTGERKKLLNALNSFNS